MQLKPYQKKARKYNFRIANESLRGSISGTLIPIEEQIPQIEIFFEALDALPMKFVKRSGLNQVQIVRDLKLRGKPCGGLAIFQEKRILLSYPVHKKTVYHELFHIFDRLDDADWKKLNHPAFFYKGSEYYSANYTQRKKKKIEKIQAKHNISDFSKDFATSYAQSNSTEDRAETFACLLNDGPGFSERARQSSVLYKKGCRIIGWTVKQGLLDRYFWQNHLKLSPQTLEKLIQDGK